MAIHPTAVIDPSAEISETADIGPYCVIGPEVRIGARTRFLAHVYTDGPMTIGEDNTFYPYSTVGVAPQDLKYQGEKSQTVIGDRNRIREFVTIHRGTEGGGMLTRIGSDNLLMAYAHVAHDVQMADHIVLGHGGTLGGHVIVGEWAVVSAHSGIHQFCRIGRHSIIGGYSVVTQDILPYSTTVSPREVKTFGANKVGLERRGFPTSTIEGLQNAFRILTRSGLNTTQALERIREEIPAIPEIDELIDFIQSAERGFVK